MQYIKGRDESSLYIVCDCYGETGIFRAEDINTLESRNRIEIISWSGEIVNFSSIKEYAHFLHCAEYKEYLNRCLLLNIPYMTMVDSAEYKGYAVILEAEQVSLSTKHLEIPEYVAEIARDAFIPDTELPSFAGRESVIETIKFGANVKRMEARAFDCPRLQKVELNAGLEVLGGNYFAIRSHVNLAEVVIPPTVKEIRTALCCYMAEHIIIQGDNLDGEEGLAWLTMTQCDKLTISEANAVKALRFMRGYIKGVSDCTRYIVDVGIKQTDKNKLTVSMEEAKRALGLVLNLGKEIITEVEIV